MNTMKSLSTSRRSRLFWSFFSYTLRQKWMIVVCIVGVGVMQGNAQAPYDRLEAARQRVAAYPNAAVYRIELGQLYLDVYRVDQRPEMIGAAYDSFWEAVQLDYESFEAHFGLGLVEFERGDDEAALFSFQQLSQLFPDRFDGHFNRAVTFVNLDRPDEAVQAFETAIAEAEPEATQDDLVSAYLGLATQQKRLERYSDAVRSYEELLALRPNDPDIGLLSSEALYLDGRGLEALPLLTKLENQYQEHRFTALVADIYTQANQVEYAKRAIERGIARARRSSEHGNEANLLLKLGLIERGLGQEAEAAQHFYAATNLDPNAWEGFYNLGLYYLQEGQVENALLTFQRALSLEQQSGALYFALAGVYDQLNNAQEAQRHAQLALQYLPETSELYPEMQLVLARATFRLGGYQEAKEQLLALLESDEGNAEAQLWMGLSAYQLGQYDEAIQYYERAAFLEPDSVEARINLGAAYLASERYQDAELVYQLLVEQNSNDYESLYNLGWALLLQNRFDEAKTVWEQSQTLGYQPAVQAMSEYF